jgi:hypothetical protein
VGGGSAGGGSVGGGSVGGGSVGGGSVGGGSVGGGSVGGGSVGGGSVGGCPCPEYEECIANSCLRRYFGITVVVPAKTRLPTVVQASLQPVPGRVQNPPPTLNVTASIDGSVGWSGSLISIADGGYASMNSFPSNVEGAWSVFVAWPDGGPSGFAMTEVDLRGPQLTVTWPAPPVPVLQPQGADFRDLTEPQDAGRFWRRSHVIPVRIESSSRDLEAASIQIRLGGDLAGVPLIGCTGDGGIEDAGLLADGGFCRIARVPASRGTFAGLRGSLALTATANDDIGNTTNSDAGLVGLSRWAFSITGSSANGFALGKRGLLVVPQTSSSSFTVLDADGSLSYERILSQPPTSNVALGQENPQRVYVLENSGPFSQGETFELDSNTQLANWAPLESRDPVLPPLVSDDSVAAVTTNRSLKFFWASYQGGLATTGFGGSSSLDAGVIGVVARGTKYQVPRGLDRLLSKGTLAEEGEGRSRRRA